MATKRALLIGIAAYPHVAHALKGSVNDVHLMRALLVDRFGFDVERITLLADDQATRAGILSAFDALVAATEPDDIVVFHFAGHGSRMADREGDEPSGFDSTIVPFDGARPPGDIPDITDDEIHLRLESLAEKTSYITLIFDACHSGTITRDDVGEGARSIEPDPRPVSELPASPIPVERRQRARAAGPSGWMPLTDRYVLIAGCRDDEQSYEYRPPEGGGAVVHGALTYFLCQQLRQAPASASYRDVFERTAALVNALNVMQHPQMEGQADRQVFGVTDATPEAFVRILEREADMVLLAAGAAHGTTVGSTYRVFPHGTRTPESGGAVGDIEVVAVQVVTAMARILREEAANAIAPDTRAFEQPHAFGDRYRRVLAIENPDPRSALRGQFTVELQTLGADRKTWSTATPAPDRGQIVLDEGQIIRAVVRSRCEVPVYVSMFDLGLSGAIAQIYPAKGAQEMLRVRELACPAQRLGFPPDMDQTEGIETVKLFVTMQPTDFLAFVQGALRSEPVTPGDEDWTTISTSFVLRRRMTSKGSPV